MNDGCVMIKGLLYGKRKERILPHDDLSNVTYNVISLTAEIFYRFAVLMFRTRWVCDLMLRMSTQSAAALHVLAALYVVTLSFCGKFGTYWYNQCNKGTYFAIQSNRSCTILNLRKKHAFHMDSSIITHT